MKRSSAMILVGFLVATAGCQDSGGPGQDPDSNTTAQNPSAAAVPAETFVPQRPATQYADPADAVRDFLVAVRAGDDDTAMAILTTKAQEEAWQNGMAISAQGFPDAKFDVSEVEYDQQKQGAHVLSTWSDGSEEGTPTFQCVWILRREPHGWAIGGMATKFIENADPVILNFEDQADMERKQRWAEQQMARAYQEQQAQVTAQTQAQTEPAADQSVRQAQHPSDASPVR